jgi:precorrin-3B synthase
LMPGMRRDGRRVHWSGCERRCGKPAGEFADVVAVGNGYLVDGERM